MPRLNLADKIRLQLEELILFAKDVYAYKPDRCFWAFDYNEGEISWNIYEDKSQAPKELVGVYIAPNYGAPAKVAAACRGLRLCTPWVMTDFMFYAKNKIHPDPRYWTPWPAKGLTRYVRAYARHIAHDLFAIPTTTDPHIIRVINAEHNGQIDVYVDIHELRRKTIKMLAENYQKPYRPDDFVNVARELYAFDS